MATIYYKATRPDGRDFRTGTVDYAAALASGERVDVGKAGRALRAECCGPSVLHASVFPTETLIGGSWPCRLFEVAGREVAREGHKRGFRSLTVVREIDATLALGPQGRQIVDLIARAERLTRDDAARLDAARGAAWDAARRAARGAAWDAAWGAARGAAGDAAWRAAGDAAWGAVALVSRDLIGQYGLTQAHYDILTTPWRRAIGPIHSDDKPLGGGS